MIFKERSVTFTEFVKREPVPLATIQEAVLAFLQDRDDAAVFGAQAVNAYVDEPRMSQDVDILTLNGEALAEALREHLNTRFGIATRVRVVAGGAGWRVYQIQKPKNRYLVDLRGVDRLPPCQRRERILIPEPAELISQKVISVVGRSRTAKGMTDVADLRRLLLTFPELKAERGPVAEALAKADPGPAVLDAWRDLVAQDIEPEDDDAY